MSQNQTLRGGVELSPTSPCQMTNTTSDGITIAFKNLSVVEHTFTDPKPYNNVYQSVAEGVLSAGKTFKLGDFYRLQEASGIIKPNTMTLVLSSTGGGRTTYLRALSQRLKTKQDAFYCNGDRLEDIAANGEFDLKKAVQYADQIDTLQLPLLTVYETLQFAAKLSNRDHSDENINKKVEHIIKTLGLTESQHTIIGDESNRGISGGQRKRCNIAQTLVTPAKVVCLDTYTDGLDSATSLSITQSLKKWCEETNGSIVATLQQPSMDLFNLFDKIVLLSKGHVIYDGPRIDFEVFLRGMGFDVPLDQDLADFVIEMLSQPEVVVAKQQLELKDAGNKNSDAHTNSNNTALVTSNGIPVIKASNPCTTLETMVDYYHSSPFYTTLLSEIDSVISSPQLNNTAQLSTEFPVAFHASFSMMLTALLTRQFRVFLRNKPIFIARVINAIIMSLFYGSLYVFVDNANPAERVGQEQLSLTLLAFSQMLELPLSLQFVEISFHQMNAKLYSSFAFVLSGFIMTLPISIIEVTIYSLIVYFMTNHFINAGAFFTFWVLSLMQSIQLATWFKMSTTITTHPVLAQALAVPATGLFMTLSGVFLFRTSIPDGMIWLYHISPFSWTVRALLNNEYLSSKYDQILTLADGITQIRYGDYLLESVDMFVGPKWIVAAVFYLLGFTLVCLFAQVFLLSSFIRPFPESTRGTKRTDSPTAEKRNTEEDNTIIVDVQATTSLPTFQQHVPFTKSWLTFQNVKYVVMAEDQNGAKYPRTLLQNVTGIAEPGKITYLMGSSGAGKTTLLSVLAQRSNSGEITGSILINGNPVTQQMAAEKIAVVEQFDTLFDFDTVYESLLFVARLKLSADLDDAIKKRIVDEVIDVLDLTHYKHSLIWTLSPGQRKTVNIGLALVSPAPCIFLDEPTTSLSSKDSLVVMTIVRRIASLGKTVIATIHQPSTTVFWLADQILLLSSGGYLQYCGPLGHRSKQFVDYFSALPKINPIAPQTNPAEWLLNELSMIDMKEQQNDFPRYFLESKIFKDMEIAIHHFSEKKMSLIDASNLVAVAECQSKQQSPTLEALPSCTVDNHSFRQTSLFYQFFVLFRRNQHYLLRNPFYVTARLIMCIGLAVVFGLIYFQSIDNPSKASNAISAVGASFVPIFFVALLHAATALPAYYELRAVFYRETQNRYYSSFLWTAVNIITEALWVIGTILITQQPLYFLVGTPIEISVWAHYLLSFFALVMTFISMSFAIASISPNFVIAQIVLGTYYMLTFSLCGLGIAAPAIPAGYYWLYKALTLGHVLESVVGIIFEHKDHLIHVVMGQTEAMIPLNTFIFNYLGIEPGHYWMMLLWVLVFNLSALLIAFLGNTFLRFNKS